MKFIDAADREREATFGERGEICVRGPNVMKGYWKKPNATADAMTAQGFASTRGSARYERSVQPVTMPQVPEQRRYAAAGSSPAGRYQRSRLCL